jgi:hypothetical protein
VTVAPSSPDPVIVRPDVFLVRLSLLVPAVPTPKVSSVAARSSAVGAATVVSTITLKTLDAVPVLVARSVAVAVKLFVPSDSGPVLFKVQSPAPSANAVPTCLRRRTR